MLLLPFLALSPCAHEAARADPPPPPLAVYAPPPATPPTFSFYRCFSGYSFNYPITFSLFSCLTTMVACALVFMAGNAPPHTLTHPWPTLAQPH